MIRKYGFIGTLRMLSYLLRTRLWYRGARLIRFPFEIRNRQNIHLGQGLTTGVGCRLEALPQKDTGSICIQFGKNIQLNDYVHIGAIRQVQIGDGVLIASKVFITDHNHGRFAGETNAEEILRPPIERALEAKPVKIGKHCWLGEQVIILPGVELGEGCIVGAGSVVTKSFPPYSLIVGNPGRLYKTYDFQSSQWIVKRAHNDN